MRFPPYLSQLPIEQQQEVVALWNKKKLSK